MNKVRQTCKLGVNLKSKTRQAKKIQMEHSKERTYLLNKKVVYMCNGLEYINYHATYKD